MQSPPKRIRSIAELRDWRSKQTGRVGFVPTMGALHEGHATLLRDLRPRCETLVLSIFVNPTQFGPKEDLSKYPRTFQNDLKVATQEKVDAVFCPSPEEIYPSGYSTFVEELRLEQPLCGQFRPGHFRGVATVVLKLFNLVQPHTACFGLKDAQQFFVVSKMAQDLNVDIEIEGIPTVREGDGLALSSRNAYLSAEERKTAPLLYQSLLRTQHELKSSGKPISTNHLKSKITEQKELLQATGFEVQYLEGLTLPNLEEIRPNEIIPTETPILLAVAAFLGKTRLIDNVIWGSKDLENSSRLTTSFFQP